MAEGPSTSSEDLSERFGATYWEEETHYGKLGDYSQALAATMRWYGGLIRLVSTNLPRAGRHLDVGCGHGAIVHLMLERGLDAHGFDASPWMIDQARNAVDGMADRFAVGDAASGIPFEGQFEVISCLEVVEHLEQPDRALKLMRSRLNPGGRLILTTPNPSNFMPFRNPAMNDPTHVSVHEPKWWRQVLGNNGFSVIDDSTYVALPYVWRFSPLLSRWIRFRRDVGPGWIAVCAPQES
jgi:SAM-dependent methyltransferase